GLAACSSSSSSSSSASSTGSAATTGKTLVMESSPETTITQAFNPFVPTQSAYGMGATGLIYEPLIQFDLASPTISYPWLATSYAWSNGDKTITFTIRQGVKWNNGTALTPADVAFTFDLVKANAAINSGGLTISSVSTSGNTVTLTFPTSQYTNLEQIAGQAIVPKSQWNGVNPGTFTDANPVGTGPYMLGSFTPQGFILKKNPYYWQPADVQVPTVDFPAYTSNTGALNALFDNQIDWTGNYIPGLQKNFVATDPAHHNYWEAAGGDESLEPNLTKWPTNQLAVRQAMSLAVNRSLLASEGEAGLASPITESGGLTLPTFQAWAGPVSSATMPSTSNVAAAEQVLTKAGFTKGSNGFFEKGGKEVSVTIISPTAYTDMAEVDSIAAQQMKAAGINATYQGLSTDAWNSDVASGDFSVTEHWSNGGISPVNMYNGWLNSTLASGSAAVGDYERLSDPALNADLATLAGATTVSAQATALVPLEQYIAANLPIIPVTTAPEWFEYNSQNYTGWPTQQNPYDSGQPSGTNNGPGSGTDEVVILHLHPR
ncbi:MAG TPA: ABC transporter substrate-binding protein, partial [Streptosporangiaceae bacterium]|nr:ABC transporter substrate-binding protein [Streptosporangiaceae bacterium]